MKELYSLNIWYFVCSKILLKLLLLNWLRNNIEIEKIINNLRNNLFSFENIKKKTKDKIKLARAVLEAERKITIKKINMITKIEILFLFSLVV